MHDCEQEFYIQVECHFDEAMFLVNDEIRKRDTYFPGVEMLEEAVWHLLELLLFILSNNAYT